MIEIKKILNSIDKTKKNYAVFDCDETIIKGDVEFATVRYQIETGDYKVSINYIKDKLRECGISEKTIENFDIKRDFVNLMIKVYIENNYEMSNTLLVGFTSNEVKNLIKKAIDRKPDCIQKRPEIEILFELLRKNNVDIYICSASHYDEVCYAADLYNIPHENILAKRLEKDKNGLYKDNSIGFSTKKEGKTKAVKSLNYDNPPVIVAGDSDGDYDMLINLKPIHGMIINPKENTKVKELVDNKIYFEYNY